MAKLIYVTLGLFMILAFVDISDGFGECPTAGQIYSCSPKCYQDSDCSNGRKCCPNSCNAKSCADPKTSGSSGHKASSSGGTGIYCNNAKCSPGEKCGIDRSTNRMKCVRA